MLLTSFPLSIPLSFTNYVPGMSSCPANFLANARKLGNWNIPGAWVNVRRQMLKECEQWRNGGSRGPRDFSAWGPPAKNICEMI